MKKLLIVALLMLPTVACGQQPVTEGTATGTNVIKPLVPANELVLKVTLPEAEIIWRAIRKLPVEEVEPLMIKLRQQVAEQQSGK